MDRQSSTASTTKILESEGKKLEIISSRIDEEDPAGIAMTRYHNRTTVTPIREEFRVKRLCFLYHDVRAFTTSWVPLPIFVLYRVVLALYLAAWLIAHGVVRSSREGAKWFIFITNLTVLFLVVSQCFLASGTVLYAFVYYFYKRRFFTLPREAPTQRDFYSQDNLPLLFKITWYLCITGNTMIVMISLGYWALIYDSEDCELEGTSCLDAAGIHFHVIAAVLTVIDIFISRFPYQLLHFFYPCSFTAVYSIFTGIYFAAGGTNSNGGTNSTADNFIYSALDYSSRTGTAVVLAIVLVFVPIVFFLLLYLAAWLRDVLYQRIAFCFRDIHTPTPTTRENSSAHNEGTDL